MMTEEKINQCDSMPVNLLYQEWRELKKENELLKKIYEAAKAAKVVIRFGPEYQDIVFAIKDYEQRKGEDET